MPLSQFVAIFLLEEVAFLFVYTFDSKKFTILFWIFFKKCNQVQKLVRPFRRAC